MMPIVNMKSSTPMPLSACTLVNTSSTINGRPGATVWLDCAEARRLALITPASMIAAAAATYLDPDVMCGPSSFLRRRGGAAAWRPGAEFLETASEFSVELRALARVPVAAMTRFARFVEILADVPQLGDIFSLRDVERFESNVAQRFDAGVPFDRVAFPLGSDLGGDSSTASGPLLLFSSPGGVNGRRI